MIHGALFLSMDELIKSNGSSKRGISEAWTTIGILIECILVQWLMV